MRALVLTMVPFFAFTGMAAAAAPSEPVRQCRIVWEQAQSTPLRQPVLSPGQCRVVHVAADERMVGYYDRPAHHVLTRDEIRAELDAIRLQVDTAQPADPSSNQPSKAD